jgi:hypothetical protein
MDMSKATQNMQCLNSENFLLFFLLQQMELYSIENKEPKHTLQPNETSQAQSAKGDRRRATTALQKERRLINP